MARECATMCSRADLGHNGGMCLSDLAGVTQSSYCMCDTAVKLQKVC
jgi:hypothetical protein